MKQGWEIKQLGEILVKTEMVDPNKNPDKDFTYLDVSSVNKETNEIEGATNLLGKDAPSRARKLVRKNDVIFATVRPTHGRVALITDEYDGQVCSTGYFVLRGKENIHNKYLFYFLLTDEFNKQMEKLQKGASYPAVTDAEVKSIFLRYPKSLPEQQHIVSILDEAFAAIAKAKANAEKNLKNAKELFESYLQGVFENKGDGWEERRLGESDLIEIIDGDRGKNYPTQKDFTDEGYCLFMNTKNVRPTGFEFNTTMFISESKDKAMGKGKLKRNDVVMTTRGTIGNLGVYDNDVEYDNIRINSGMLIFRPNLKQITSEYLFEILRSGVIKEQIKKQVTGAAQPQLPIKTLVNFVFPVPKSLKEQQVIVQKLDALSTETKKLETIYQQKLNDLEELKKSVLQKAFSGELK
jgi:type I restriction enzyme, S subunit